MTGFDILENEIVYAMCFLPVAAQPFRDEHDYYLITLTGLSHRPWLTLTIVGVSGASSNFKYDVKFIETIAEDGSLLEAAKSGNLIFKLSHSNEILVVAGNEALFFFAVKTRPKLGLVEIMREKEHSSIGSIVSCLCMPPINASILDWMVFGTDDGALIGLAWGWNKSMTNLEMRHIGRFPSKYNTHDAGVPVGLLMGTYGSTPDAHHRDLHDGVYSFYLARRPFEKDRFYSLANNGRLLQWKFNDKMWTAVEETGFKSPWIRERSRCEAEELPQYVAAQSSKLVPNIMVALGQGRNIVCKDTRKMGLQVPRCRFGGA
jgi:hypothetical protein